MTFTGLTSLVHVWCLLQLKQSRNVAQDALRYDLESVLKSCP